MRSRSMNWNFFFQNIDFSSCKAAYKWEAKIHNICDRAALAYNRNNRPCSFFDPSLEHGGPQVQNL